jgi:hypothetical protein
VVVLQLPSIWPCKTRFRVYGELPHVVHFHFFFASLNDGVVVILQLLILLKASPTFFCYEKKGVLQLSLQLSF